MKFLVDSMLGKLARFLRIFGYDTLYANDLIDFFKRDPVPDEQLLVFAKETNRFVITKDYLFYKSFANNAIYLKGEGVYNYLNQLKKNLGLNFKFNIQHARCSICNSKMKKVEEISDIKHLILQETFNQHNEFYQCLNSQCKKIYWKGSHIDDIEKRLSTNSITD
ncbi:MAG: Mut7-C RNAse domain-containing protein [Candidatus Hodarchaeota archaeon]